jgi:hypothetical protein
VKAKEVNAVAASIAQRGGLRLRRSLVDGLRCEPRGGTRAVEVVISVSVDKHSTFVKLFTS